MTFNWNFTLEDIYHIVFIIYTVYVVFNGRKK